MEPDHFFEFARELREAGYEGGPAYRTMISRAYYAAHLKAHSTLLAKRVDPTRGQEDGNQRIHRLVINSMRNLRWYGLADNLDELRELRVRADYSLREDVDGAAVATSFKLAERILGELDHPPR